MGGGQGRVGWRGTNKGGGGVRGGGGGGGGDWVQEGGRPPDARLALTSIVGVYYIYDTRVHE